jgi:Kef-type K+ transport system membrane component KefB
MPLLEAFAGALGQIAGQTFGYLLAAVLYLIIVFLLWGFPWSRIIAKAGHRGKTYWTLTLMMFAPVAIAPLAGSNSEFAQFCAGVVAVSLYLVIWFLALFPWQQAKLKSDRP